LEDTGATQFVDGKTVTSATKSLAVAEMQRNLVWER
jgi:hypothetical protein